VSEDALRAADLTVADWIAPRLGEIGSVAGTAPGGFDRYVRVFHPAARDQRPLHMAPGRGRDRSHRASGHAMARACRQYEEYFPTEDWRAGRGEKWHRAGRRASEVAKVVTVALVARSAILRLVPQTRKITKGASATTTRVAAAGVGKRESAASGGKVKDPSAGGGVVVRTAKSALTGRAKTVKTKNTATLGAGASTGRTATQARRRRSSSRAPIRKPAAHHAGEVKISELTEPLTSTLHEILGKGAMGASKIAAALTDGSPGALKSLRDLIDRTLTARDYGDGLAPDVWGAAPTRAEVMDAQARAELSRAAALDQTVRDSLTRDEVAARLGISAQAVSKRTKADQLVVLRHGGRAQYPLWQFADDGVLPSVSELIDEFPSALSLSVWMTTPSADLDGLTPAKMLQQRDGRARILELARAASPSAW
jgi:hypothetical protein